MISQQDKIEILKKVVSSAEFSQSTKSQDLLKYLVDASMRNSDLNEITIASEFFGKNSNFNPLEDASIRVYVSKIRKKLEHYYLTEGKDDDIQIDIPRGRYVVRFREKKAVASEPAKTRTFFLIFPILTLVLSVLVIFLWMRMAHLQDKLEILPRDNPVWFEFLQSEKPTKVVLGDYFFLYNHHPDDGRRINVRDPSINSLDEFKAYIENNPDQEKNLQPLVHSYLRPNAIWGMAQLLPILRSTESHFQIKLASELVWEDISSNNIIFLGTFKTMYILKPLLENINIGFSLYPYPFHLYMYENNGEEKQRFDHTMDFETRKFSDYGLVTKFVGPNDNTMMFITGFDEGGVIQACREVSKADFSQRLLNDDAAQLAAPFFFKTVLGVQGFQRADVSTNIEYFEIID